MTDQRALHAIDAALKQVGFTKDWGRSAHPFYIGSLTRDEVTISVSIEIPDLNFVDFPKIRLNRETKSPFLIPHLMSDDGQICYFGQSTIVLDQYDPGGTVLRCLAQAKDVIIDGIKGKLDPDFAAEFANYWSSLSALVDLPPEFSGTAEISWVSFRKDVILPVLHQEHQLASSFHISHTKTLGVQTTPKSNPCIVINTNKLLGSNWDGRRLPATLKELSRFVAGVGDGLAVDQVLREGEGLNRWIAIRSPNAACLACIMIPQRFDKPEFMITRKQSLPETLSSVDVPVERYRGMPIDAEFLYQRNLGDLPSLRKKKIALVGCGTIGAFLAMQLAQSGAGSLKGKLSLVDRESLSPSNLGRHLLGIEYLYRNKARGTAAFIKRQLPHLDIDYRPINILDGLETLSKYDLIIDATGEEALSIAINAQAVARRPNFPPVLYVWLVGNGGAAQSLLCEGPEHGCFKCQKPELAKAPRYRVVRPDSAIDLRHTAACGDGLYAPFPVSRSLSAAALGLEAVLAWNTGNPGARYRTIVLDEKLCFHVKVKELSPSPICPACATGHA